MAVPVEEAIAALSTFSLEDEQQEVQGPGLWVSTERGATESPIEYSDVSAYRLSLSEDTKAFNQLNALIQEGKEMASVLYTYRSCVKALPQLPDSMKQSQADLYLETYQVLDSFLTSFLSFQRRTSIPELQVIPKLPKMTSQILRSVSKATRSLLSASKGSRFYSEGRAVAAVAAMSLRGTVPFLASNYGKAGSENMTREWISGALAVSAAAYMLQEQEAHAAENERTFIAIKPDGVQRGLIAEIISRFERKGFKLVAIKIVVPSKGFAEKHYHDLKERPFFNGLCDFLSSGPVIAMVWEGEGVIKYGRKLIGATDPQKSEPGTIRGDLAVVVGRNIIHGSDGLETAKDEINLWFKPEELVTYTSNSEKWVYGAN